MFVAYCTKAVEEVRSEATTNCEDHYQHIVKRLKFQFIGFRRGQTLGEVLAYWYLHFLSPVVDCGSLSDPDNGRVDISQGTTYNAMATYSCNSPYTLNRTRTRTCQANGTWDPTCGRFGH